MGGEFMNQQQGLRVKEKLESQKAAVFQFLPAFKPYCNFRCSGCYLLESKTIASSVRRSEGEIIQSMKQLRLDGYSVLPSTTEILMFKRFAEMLETCGSKYLLTNGKIVVQQPALLKEAKAAGVQQVVVTINTGDSGLVLPDKDVAFQAAKLASGAGLDVAGRVRITPKNYGRVSEIVEGCMKRGVRTIQFLRNLVLSGQEEMLNGQKLCAFFQKLEEARRSFPLGEAGAYVSASGSLGGVWRKKPFKCNAGKSPITIGVDNNIYPCIYLTQEENRIGRFENGKVAIFREFKNPGREDECPAYNCLEAKQKSP
jgi:MoaA/NifB/PqqE/SkfB family radical SAM enzyme